jgi:hypothetical protein
MLGNPSIRRYHFGGDNVTGAGNQQERPTEEEQEHRSLRSDSRFSSDRNPQRPYAELSVERTEMKRWSMLCGDMRKDMNYNRGLLPTGGCKTWPNAGTPEYPTVLICVTPR